MIFTKMSVCVSPILEKIHQLPFNTELASGFLSQDKFIFYLIQDALYLSDFSRALALTATKLSDNELMQQFLSFAHEAIQAERELHKKYIQTPHDLTTEVMPACFMYTNYLLKMASTASVEEAVASLLPCFWVYQEVGMKIAEACDTQQHPYREWIELYSSEGFNVSVEAAIGAVNKLGNNASNLIRENMVKAFVKSTKLEWLFWHGAYQQEMWQI